MYILVLGNVSLNLTPPSFVEPSFLDLLSSRGACTVVLCGEIAVIRTQSYVGYTVGVECGASIA